MNADKPTEAAMRAARSIGEMVTVHFGEALYSSMLESTAAIIDRETGVRDLEHILEEIIAEAGDLIDKRSLDILEQARTALRQSADQAPRERDSVRVCLSP